MRNDNYTYGGPVWTISSNEVAAAAIIWFMIILFPVFPLVSLGYYVGSEIIGNNISKWGFSIGSFILGYWILLAIKNNLGLRASILTTLLMYLVMDVIFSSKTNQEVLMIMKLIDNALSWALSNS